MSAETFGTFPFGRPNTPRPARTAGRAAATVIGVYPSAFHVEWRAPAHLVAGGRSGRVRALAVDVEPEVFWEGDGFDERLQAWKTAVGFDPAGSGGGCNDLCVGL
jgi:hypothetical protein